MASEQKEPPENFKPLGVIDCPHCDLPSLSWNEKCARCGGYLFPQDGQCNIDETEKHTQGNAA